MSLRSQIQAKPALRAALAFLALAALVGSIALAWPDGGSDSTSLYPRLDMQELIDHQRNRPTIVLLSLAGRCQGDWRSLPEPARQVWITLKYEFTGAQPDNSAAPTDEEVDAAYDALGLGAQHRAGSLRGHVDLCADAREGYIRANPAAFTP